MHEDDKPVSMALDRDELRGLVNALNLLLYGLEVDELETLLGIERPEAEALLERLRQAYSETSKPA